MQTQELTQEFYVGKSKSYLFAYLNERLWKRIQGCKEKLLSKARKETSIKEAFTCTTGW